MYNTKLNKEFQKCSIKQQNTSKIQNIQIFIFKSESDVEFFLSIFNVQFKYLLWFKITFAEYKIEYMHKKLFFILLFKILIFNSLTAQIPFFERDTILNKKRLYGLIGATAVGYTGAVLLLNNVWYAQYPKSSLHSFDDNGEWLQMDKGGHVLTAYVESKWAFQAFR